MSAYHLRDKFTEINKDSLGEISQSKKQKSSTGFYSTVKRRQGVKQWKKAMLISSTEEQPLQETLWLTGTADICFQKIFCCFQETMCLLSGKDPVAMHIDMNNYQHCLTLTPSACACRPGALRPCVLTPGVFAGCGLGAGVVRTCVFPEFCKLLDDRILPILPTLPLRSPPPHINTHTNAFLWGYSSKKWLSHCYPDNTLPASGLRSTHMSSLVLLCCPRVGEPWGLGSAVREPITQTHKDTQKVR